METKTIAQLKLHAFGYKTSTLEELSELSGYPLEKLQAEAEFLGVTEDLYHSHFTPGRNVLMRAPQKSWAELFIAATAELVRLGEIHEATYPTPEELFSAREQAEARLENFMRMPL